MSNCALATLRCGLLGLHRSGFEPSFRLLLESTLHKVLGLSVTHVLLKLLIVCNNSLSKAFVCSISTDCMMDQELTILGRHLHFPTLRHPKFPALLQILIHISGEGMGRNGVLNYMVVCRESAISAP